MRLAAKGLNGHLTNYGRTYVVVVSAGTSYG